MMRVSYRHALTGEQRVIDLVGPSDWKPEDYATAVRRQNRGAEVLSLEPIAHAVRRPVGARYGQRLFRVTLKPPGRPETQILLPASSFWDATRRAMDDVAPGAKLIRCSDGHG